MIMEVFVDGAQPFGEAVRQHPQGSLADIPLGRDWRNAPKLTEKGFFSSDGGGGDFVSQ